MNGSRSVRALIVTLTTYGIGRTLIVWAPAWWPVAVQTALPPAQAAMPIPAPAAPALPPRGRAIPPTFPSTRPQTSVGPPLHIALLADAPAPMAATISLVRIDVPPAQAIEQAGAAAPPAVGPVIPRMSSASRWSGYAYLFHRRDATSTPLAPGGQIGGAQAAARIAYRLDDTGRVAAAARIATPLHGLRQAEVAAGLDLLPLPGLRVSVERRHALGPRGRNAWSAYAAAGVFRSVAPRVELDGYAQAGLVGTRARDPFADAALRLSHRTGMTDGTDLRIGAGAWGAAQPGATRLDIGPRAAVTVRATRLPVTLAIEGRFRIAGRARPGNGAALTLATDF
ncbi:MAG TPA: hypothetical protein VF649_00470 [Sphingomonas sp.]|jgi:hypothetical protein|uniref:hypothetical protein n=1 Tax=Sphingomonas sp. TaxID=28214 RepID=UPI002ED7712A